jgi:hypothetical protein
MVRLKQCARLGLPHIYLVFVAAAESSVLDIQSVFPVLRGESRPGNFFAAYVWVIVGKKLRASKSEGEKADRRCITENEFRQVGSAGPYASANRTSKCSNLLRLAGLYCEVERACRQIHGCTDSIHDSDMLFRYSVGLISVGACQ